LSIVLDRLDPTGLRSVKKHFSFIRSMKKDTTAQDPDTLVFRCNGKECIVKKQPEYEGIKFQGCGECSKLGFPCPTHVKVNRLKKKHSDDKQKERCKQQSKARIIQRQIKIKPRRLSLKQFCKLRLDAHIRTTIFYNEFDVCKLTESNVL